MAKGKKPEKGGACSGKNLPYLVTHAGPNSRQNHGSSATPFSAPWQRYSKPKFQEETGNANQSSG